MAASQKMNVRSLKQPHPVILARNYEQASYLKIMYGQGISRLIVEAERQCQPLNLEVLRRICEGNTPTQLQQHRNLHDKTTD